VIEHSLHGDQARQDEGCGGCVGLAVRATAHCLTGCAIGEVLGLMIATAVGLAAGPSIALAVTLAFLFGYGLTMVPLVRGGLTLRAAMGVALLADTLTIAVMEIVDNAIMMLIPDAMEAGLGDPLFWGSLAVALAAGFVAALPVSYWLIRRGAGHAIVHRHHEEQHG
jgi:hypothetical protein